jgi:cadmium resistance protein CadD (predicted permease)
LSMGIFLVEDVTVVPEHYQGGVFVIALAAGFVLITLLTRIFTREAHWWALIVAGLLSLVGSGIIIIEMPDAGLLQQVVEAVFTASQYLWPLVLVGLGLWIIFKKRDAAS